MLPRHEIDPQILVRRQIWNYYSNSDGSIAWQTGLFRYLDKTTTERVLADTMGALGDSDQSGLIYSALKRKVLPRHGATSGAFGGEGEAHKALKQRVAADPTLVGLPATAKPNVEYQFVSGDKVDIKFDLPDQSYAVVEIETTIPFPGAHQCIKYRVSLEAALEMPINSGRVLTILVAYAFDQETNDFTVRYGITTYALSPE